jgi:cobalamin biosynthesis protein CobD/CbiB
MLNRKIALTFLLIFTSIIFNAQCAMCKAVVESGNISMAEGVNSGITYLMVFPYLLIGVLFYVIYRYKKEAKI